MKPIHISIATGIRGNAANKTYSTQAEITSLDELQQAVQYDHVAGSFKNNERRNEHFISTDCLMMDCDNDSSDKAAEWLSPEKLHDRLPAVAFAVIYSKSHMRNKNDKNARPRFHVYFPLSRTITEPGHVARLKEALLQVIPEFDRQAKDAARFFYGVETPKGCVFEGIKCVDEIITANEEKACKDTQKEHTAATSKPYNPPAMTHGYSNAGEGRVISQFLEFIYSVGIRPLHDLRIIPDGVIHRFATEADAVSKKTGKAGAYCLHMDGHPAGWVMDFRGNTYNFTYEFTTEERREYGRRNAQQRAHDEQLRLDAERNKEEKKKLQAEQVRKARLIALAEYRSCSYDLSANGYFRARFTEQEISIKDLNMTRYKESYIGHEVLYECEVIRQYPLRVCLGAIQELLIETPKGIEAHAVKGICRKGELIVPFINVETGLFQTIQRINHEGQKFFYQGLSPKGAAFVMWPKNNWREDVNTPQVDTDTVQTVFVCEGVCTALALWQDCNGFFPVYSAGSWENLQFVCAGLRKWLRNDVKILIAADNDNSGITAAQKCKDAGLAHGIRLPHVQGGDWYDEIISKKG